MENDQVGEKAEEITENEVALRMFTIYRFPLDYPDKWVVRGWNIMRGGRDPLPDLQPTAVADDLGAARLSIPVGMFRMTRSSEDDPAVYETWV